MIRAAALFAHGVNQNAPLHACHAPGFARASHYLVLSRRANTDIVALRIVVSADDRLHFRRRDRFRFRENGNSQIELAEVCTSPSDTFCEEQS